MICQRCGSIAKNNEQRCAFCGEPLVPNVEDTLTHLAGTAAKNILAKLEPLEKLNNLAIVPDDKGALVDELKRLEKYFTKYSAKYELIDDLWLKRLSYRAPSFANWTVGGGLATILIYAIVGGILPSLVWAFFFVPWGAITCIGYISSGRNYELMRARIKVDIRHYENELRKYYNQAENNFLPFDYTSPQAIHELILGLESGKINSFSGYHTS